MTKIIYNWLRTQIKEKTPHTTSFPDIFQFLVTNMLNTIFYLWKIEIPSIFKFFYLNYFSYVFLILFFSWIVPLWGYLSCYLSFEIFFCVCVCLATKKLAWELIEKRKIKNKTQVPHKFFIWIFLKPVKYFHNCD